MGLDYDEDTVSGSVNAITQDSESEESLESGEESEEESNEGLPVYSLDNHKIEMWQLGEKMLSDLNAIEFVDGKTQLNNTKYQYLHEEIGMSAPTKRWQKKTTRKRLKVIQKK